MMLPDSIPTYVQDFLNAFEDMVEYLKGGDQIIAQMEEELRYTHILNAVLRIGDMLEGIRIRNTGTFTSFFKDKKSKGSTKQKKSRFFLLFLLEDRRIRNRSRILSCDYRIQMRIREAQKHTDPTDPDPQH
jgi:hypothetical protein